MEHIAASPFLEKGGGWAVALVSCIDGVLAIAIDVADDLMSPPQ